MGRRFQLILAARASLEIFRISVGAFATILNASFRLKLNSFNQPQPDY